MAWVPLDELLARRSFTKGEMPLFGVRRTAAVEHPVTHRGLERIAPPLLERSRRHHIGMPGETE